MKVFKWLFVFLAVLQLPFLYPLYQSYRLHRYLSRFPEEGVEMPAPFQDLRGAIHVHSAAGGHSLGTYPEIIQAAKAADFHYLFITEHPKDPALFNPIHDPDLVLIYGNEEKPENGLRILSSGGGQVTFLTHFNEEEIPDGVDGIELFNLHQSLERNDSWYNRFNLLYQRVFFPELFFFHLWDFDPKRFRLWDQALQKRPVVGIAGNDAHQNVGILLQTADGKVLFSFLIDPYLESFRSVSTHVLLPLDKKVSTEAILEGLRRGSAYVAFEKIADSTGFSFYARQEGKIFPMGSRVKRGASLILRSPAPARFLLIRSGHRHKELEGKRFVVRSDEPGAYRLEVYPLRVPALARGKPWIVSNPIFVE